jgi:hypothetical protein
MVGVLIVLRTAVTEGCKGCLKYKDEYSYLNAAMLPSLCEKAINLI